MAPPGEDNGRIAFFCTSTTRPSGSWLVGTCTLADEYDNDLDTPLSLISKDNVDTTGWTVQQVAEWVVEHLATEDDDRASRSFIIADDKSEATNSIVIVTIDFSSFEKQEEAADSSMRGDVTEAGRLFIGVKEEVGDLDGKSKDKPSVKIESSFRAHPEWCFLATLFQSDIHGPEQYAPYDHDNPDNPDLILQASHEEELKSQEQLIREPNQDYIIATASVAGKGPPYHYSLANDWITTTNEFYSDDDINAGRAPPVDFNGEKVPIVGRYDPHSLPNGNV